MRSSALVAFVFVMSFGCGQGGDPADSGAQVESRVPVVEPTPAPTNQFGLSDMLAEPQMVAPPGFLVTHAILTAPFGVTAITSGAEEEEVLTAVILNYDTEQKPWALELNNGTVHATLKNGERIAGSFFVFQEGWLVENTGEGSLDYRIVTVTINDSTDTLNSVGLGSVAATSEPGQNRAWFLFPVADSSQLAAVSLGRLSEVQGEE